MARLTANEAVLLGANIVLAVALILTVMDVLSSSCPLEEALELGSSFPAKKEVIPCIVSHYLRLFAYIFVVCISACLSYCSSMIRSSRAVMSEPPLKWQVFAKILIMLLSAITFFSPPATIKGAMLWTFVVIWASVMSLVLRNDLGLLMAVVAIMEGYIFYLSRYNLRYLGFLVIPVGCYIMSIFLSAALRKKYPTFNGNSQEGTPLTSIRVEVPSPVISDDSTAVEETLNQPREEARNLAAL